MENRINNEVIKEDIKKLIKHMLSTKNGFYTFWRYYKFDDSSSNKSNMHLDTVELSLKDGDYVDKILAISVYAGLFDGCLCGCRGDYMCDQDDESKKIMIDYLNDKYSFERRDLTDECYYEVSSCKTVDDIINIYREKLIKIIKIKGIVYNNDYDLFTMKVTKDIFLNNITYEDFLKENKIKDIDIAIDLLEN